MTDVEPISTITKTEQLHAGEQWFSTSENNGVFGFFRTNSVPEEYRDIYFYLNAPYLLGGQHGSVKGDYTLQDKAPFTINNFTMIHDDTTMLYEYGAAGTVTVKYIDTDGNEIAKAKLYGYFPSYAYSSSFFTPIQIENYNFIETKYDIVDLIYKAGVNDVVYHIYSLIQPIEPVEPVEPEPTPEPTPTPEPVQPTQPTQPTSITPTVQRTQTTAIIDENPQLTAEYSETNIISDPEIPKAAPEKYWALLNLILSILTVIFGLIFVLHGKDDDLEVEDKRKVNIVKIIAALVAIASVIVFIFTEDMTVTMAWIDKWTILMAVILVGEFIIDYYIHKKSQNDEEEEEEEELDG